MTLEEAFHGAARTLRWEDGRTIQAKIPRGVRTGSRVRLSGQGDRGAGGAKRGDLYLNIEELPHAIFQRDGDDLRTTAALDLYTALLGGTIKVSTIDRSVDLKIPPETQNGKVFRLRGLGMPRLRQPDQRGDLLVNLTREHDNAVAEQSAVQIVTALAVAAIDEDHRYQIQAGPLSSWVAVAKLRPDTFLCHGSIISTSHGHLLSAPQNTTCFCAKTKAALPGITSVQKVPNQSPVPPPNGISCLVDNSQCLSPYA